MQSRTVDKPPRCVEGSYFTRTGKPARYINSIRIQNLPKTIDVFDKLKTAYTLTAQQQLEINEITKR